MSADETPMLTTDPINARHRSSAPPHEVAPGVLLHAKFVNTYAVRTGAGLLLVDPGLAGLSQSVFDAVRAWSDAPLHSAVYTHGHVDHAFGLRAFLEAGETPNIIAQENCTERFRRYHMTNGYNAIINQRQFSRPNLYFPDTFDWPTLTFRESLVQRMGETEVVFSAAKGETDDHCHVWLPEQGYLFTGDLVIWHAPNCGNPQKVQRYPAEWADALEAMAGLNAEWLFPGHGMTVHGKDAVRTMLTETAAYLRHIIAQVLERLNAGQTPEEIFHGVEADPELSKRPYLRAAYDHPKFIVRNLIRLWGGWWDGNPANLMPAPWAAQAKEIAALAGGNGAVIARARSLLEAGDAVLASHLAEWACQADPAAAAAQELRRDVFKARLDAAGTTMEQGIFRATMNDARAALGQEPEIPTRGGAIAFGARMEG